MQEPSLREVFRVSWKLTMRYKALWVLGLFAMILGQLGVIDVVSGIFKGASEKPILGATSDILYVFSPDTLRQVGATLDYSFDSWGALALLLVIIFGLGVALVVVAAIAQGGIVHAAALSMKHGLKTIEKFDESWHAGAKHASAIVVLHIVKKCMLFALSLLVAAAALAAVTVGSTLSVFIFLIVFVLAIALGVGVSMLTLFAVAYLVVEEKSVFQSLQHAWKLLKSHWVVSCEVGIALVGVNMLAGLALILGIYIFVVPSLALNAYGALIGSSSISESAISLGIVLFLAYAAIIGSIVTVFVTAAWTYLFAIMHRWGLKSRVHAFVTRLKNS